MAEARKHTLKPLLEACCWSVRDTLGSLVGKKVQVDPRALTATTPESVAARLRSRAVVVRGRLEAELTGHNVCFLCDVGEAITLAGAMLLAPDEAVAKKCTARVLAGDEEAAFAEIANAVCSGIDSVLRDHLGGTTTLRLQDHVLLEPGAADLGPLGREPLYELTFSLQVGDFPRATASLLVDKHTGECWNGGPVEFAAGTAADGAGPAESDDEEDPAAPVRGRLAAFLVDGHTTPVLRKACRRIGLDLDKRPRGEVPNPAANRDAVVLIEIPPADDRRFDWCRRIKTFRAETKVALLLVLPSRHQVLQAARAGADVVLGHPLAKEHLVAKLSALLDGAPNPEEPSPAGSRSPQG